MLACMRVFGLDDMHQSINIKLFDVNPKLAFTVMGLKYCMLFIIIS